MNRRVIINKFKDDDLDIKIGIDISFTGKGIFKSTNVTKDQIKSNIINLLLTNKGERLFDPEFGCDLQKLLFDPMRDSSIVESMIQPQIDKYIPQIELLNISVDNSYNEYTMLVQIEYKIKHTSSVDVVNIAI